MRARLRLLLCFVGGLAPMLGGCVVATMPEPQRLLFDMAFVQPSVLRPAGPGYRRVPVAWTAERGPMTGDLYLPSPPALASLVLVPGLAEQGKDDPRLVNSAIALARAHFAVLVPEMPGLRRLRMAATDAEDIAGAARFLAEGGQPGVPAGPAGIAAISYSAGPAVLAATRPEAADHVAFVFSVGGYYDMAAVITYMTTGQFRERPGAPWQRGAPDPLLKWNFLRYNADRFVGPSDAERLRRIAERRIADPADAAPDLVAGLGPEGRAVHALIVNTDPDAVPALIAAAPGPLGEMVRAVSPAAHDMDVLRARLLLVHGTADPLVPISESRRLRSAVPAGQAELFEIDGLRHVGFDRPTARDQELLIHAVQTLIAMRDELAYGPGGMPERAAVLRR